MHLENCITDVVLQIGDNDMGYERRKIIVSFDNDGIPIYKDLQAKTQDEMNVKIVQAFIASGRIWDYMKKPSEIATQNQNSNTDNINVKVYCYDWLERKRKLKETTRANYKKYIDDYIIPAMGQKNIQDIRPGDVQDMLDKFSHLSKKTQHDMKAILHQIMKYAISDELIKKNPCDSVDIELTSTKESHREALDIVDCKNIIENLHQLSANDARFVAIIAFTGIRRGEALGLKKEDIDLEAGTISIRRNVTHPQRNLPTVTSPKTQAGIRTLPIADGLKPFLDNLQDGFLFGGKEPLTLSAFRAMWRRINKCIDMHKATPHVLRHSFITYAVGESNDYKTVQGLSGHADMNTLLNRYAHPQEAKMKMLSQKINQILT